MLESFETLPNEEAAQKIIPKVLKTEDASLRPPHKEQSLVTTTKRKFSNTR